MVPPADSARPGQPNAAAPSYVPHRREWLFAAAVYALLTLVYTWPLARDLAGTTLTIGPDGNLFMWTLGWDVHAFTHRPLAIFDANIYHPLANTLAYSENLIGSALLAAPVIWLGGNPALAYNVVALLSVWLCALGTYVLARRFGLSPWAAGLAGFVFGFSPARLFRTAQLHLGPMQWMPFGLAALYWYLRYGRRRDLWLACAFFTLQSFTSGHGAAFLALAYALLIGHHALAGRPLEPLRRVRDLGFAGVALLLPTALLYLPYRRAQVGMGLRRTLENWVVTPESYIVSPAHLQQWVLAPFGGARLAETASAYLFPGWLPLCLALAALAWQPRPAVWWRERGHPIGFALMLTLAGVWLSIGPPFGLWPLVYDWPGLSFVRVPSRFLIPGMLGLSLLAGFGFDRLTAARRSGLQRTVGALATVIMAAEFVAMPLSVSPAPPEPPAADRWLASVPGPVVVAEVPLEDPRRAGPFERRQTEFMLHTMAHWHPTVHGYSGIRPPMHDVLYGAMLSFPDDACLDRLVTLGVTHIVVHPALYPPGIWPAMQERIETRRDRLALRFAAASGRVYALR